MRLIGPSLLHVVAYGSRIAPCRANAVPNQKSYAKMEPGEEKILYRDGEKMRSTIKSGNGEVPPGTRTELRTNTPGFVCLRPLAPPRGTHEYWHRLR